MLQLLERVIELENWTEGKGLIVRGAKNTFCSGSDLNAVKALSTSEASMWAVYPRLLPSDTTEKIMF